jgi:hypothetical protein
VGCTELAEIWSHCGQWRKRWAEKVFNIMKCMEFTDPEERITEEMLRRSGDSKAMEITAVIAYTVIVWV